MPKISLQGNDTELTHVVADDNTVSFTAGCSKVRVSRSTLKVLAELPVSKPKMPTGWYRVNINRDAHGRFHRADAQFIGDTSVIFVSDSTHKYPGCVLMSRDRNNASGDPYPVYRTGLYPDSEAHRRGILWLQDCDFIPS